MKINKAAFIASIFFIVVVCQVVYYNALETDFQFDDSWQVQDNFSVRDIGQETSTLFSDPRRYVTRMSYALNYYFSDASKTDASPIPKPFHIVNNIIHSINGVLVFVLTVMLLSRLGPEKKPVPFAPKTKAGKPIAKARAAKTRSDEYAQGRFALLAGFFAGTIFVVHPLFSEGVTYISGRSSSLCTMFCLISIVLYLLARRFGERRWFISAVYFAIFSFLCFMLSLLTKETGLVVPVLIILIEVCVLSRGRLGRALRAWPYFTSFLLVFGLVSGWVVWRLLTVGRVTAVEGFFSLSYLLAQTEIVIHYIWMLVMPVGLSIDHTWPQFPEFSLRFVWYILILLMMLAFAVLAFQRLRKAEHRAGWVLAFLAMAWFFVSLAPTSSFIMLGDWMVERRVYMAGVFPVICSGCVAAYVILRLFAEGGWRRMLVVTTMMLAVGGLGVGTVLRNAEYNTPMSLWMPAMKNRPLNFRMCDSVALCWMMTASDYYSQGRYRQGLGALRNAEKMIEIAEENPFLRDDQHMHLLRARSSIMLLRARGRAWTSLRASNDDPAEIRRIEQLCEAAINYAHESRLFALPINMRIQRLECNSKIITAALQLGYFDFEAWLKYSKKAEDLKGEEGRQAKRLAESFGKKAHDALRHATGQYELYVADWPSREWPHYAERRARYEVFLAYLLLTEYYRTSGQSVEMSEVLRKATSLDMGLSGDVGDLFLEYYNRMGISFGGEHRFRR